MSTKPTPSTSYKHLTNILKQQQTGMVPNLQELNYNETTTLPTPNDPVTSACLDILKKVISKYRHPAPTKKQLSPHPHLPINYGCKTQLSAALDDSPPLPQNRIKRIQDIVGALLYYARAVDNKILTALNAIAARQANANEATEQTVHHLLDYCSTYLNDGTIRTYK